MGKFKPERVKMFSLLAVAAIAVLRANADLPIHCVRESVLGEWSFKVGEEHNDVHQCGYPSPDNNRHHFDHKAAYLFDAVPEKALRVKLEAPNKVTCVHGCVGEGTFTMVYDEGFNIKIDGKSLFTFFHYEPLKYTNYKDTDKVEDYVTNCYKTRTGWLHTDETQSKKWSCFSGTLINPEAQGQDKFSYQKDVITGEPVVSPSSKMKKGDEYAAGSFIVQSVRISEHATFKHNETAIAEQNKDPTTWHAKKYDHFEGRSMASMMRLLGSDGHTLYRTPNQRYRRPNPSTVDTVELSEGNTVFPEKFDWRNYGINTAIADQGDCGSCYAVSTMDMAAMRWDIKQKGGAKKVIADSRGAGFMSKHRSGSESVFTRGRRTKRRHSERVSAAVNDIIKKDFYDQGCAGGYPFLVSKYGKDVGHLFGKPKARAHHSLNSTNSHEGSSLTRITVASYGYVGGYYGGCSEEAMRKEILERGPIVVAFNAPSELFSYEKGVFQSSEKVEHVDNWEKTNHAVLAMGWGKDEAGKKYWVVKNSWGSNWGDQGYFKMHRGADECAFESMGITLHYE